MTEAPSLRLAVVLSHPTQYYSPWFRWLATHTSLNFRVFYLWDFGVKATRDPRFQTDVKWDVDLLSGYSSEFSPNVSTRPGAEHFGGFDNPDILKRLSAWKPEAVLLFGYAYRSHLRVLAWARLQSVPVIFRGDSHFLGRAEPSAQRKLLLEILYWQFEAFTYVGRANRAYFQRLGVPAAKLHFAPHSVSQALFDPAEPATLTAAQKLRHELGLSAGTRVVVFAGKFVAEKQPRELLAAFLYRPRENAALVFVGDGPEKAALVTLAQSAPPGMVHFLPFANQSEMPARYQLADIFCLPSRGFYETWGLAVNEAMHMGRPCLVSDRVGCQQDLVTNDETGWVFAAENYAQLESQLTAALTADLAPLRERISARISSYTYAQTTTGLLGAIRSLPR